MATRWSQLTPKKSRSLHQPRYGTHTVFHNEMPEPTPVRESYPTSIEQPRQSPVISSTSIYTESYLPVDPEPAIIYKKEKSPSLSDSSYTFVEPLPDKYLCGICKSMLTEPHVTECCGQHFCKECIKKSEYRQTQCPHCRQWKFRHFQYLPFKREINDLQVSCPRKTIGCDVQVSYGDRHSHDEVCEYEQISCTNFCGEDLFRKDLESHIESECELRKYSCELCGEDGKYNEIKSEEHESICPDVIVKCPNSCNVEFKRRDEHTHKLICVEEKVSCDFAEAGCQATPKRKDLESHMYSDLKQHLSQLMTAYTALKLEFKAYKEKHEDNEDNKDNEDNEDNEDSEDSEDCSWFI